MGVVGEMSVMRLFIFLALACLALVASDEPAAGDMQTMVSLIKSGKFDNNFFDGNLLKSSSPTEDQKVGGCLLDKVGAITRENGFVEFPNDLKVDLAACCTKGGQAKSSSC